jgi:hypothetical protein
MGTTMSYQSNIARKYSTIDRPEWKEELDLRRFIRARLSVVGMFGAPNLLRDSEAAETANQSWRSVATKIDNALSIYPAWLQLARDERHRLVLTIIPRPGHENHPVIQQAVERLGGYVPIMIEPNCRRSLERF